MLLQRVVRGLAALLLAVTLGGCGAGAVGAALASKSGSDDGGSGGPPPVPELDPVPPDPGLYKSLQGTARGLALGDFVPKVGHVDVVVIFDDHPQRVAVLEGDGEGGLKELPGSGFYVVGSPTIGVATVPDPKGGLDGILVWTANTLELARWDGDGFVTSWIDLKGVADRDAVLGRFDDNDILDVAVTSDERSIEVFEVALMDGGSAGLNPIPIPRIPAAGRVLSLSAAKFCDDPTNPDPKKLTDLAVLTDAGRPNRVDLFCNLGHGHFEQKACKDSFPHPTTYLTKDGGFDIDGDKLPDVGTIRTGGTGTIFVRRFESERCDGKGKDPFTLEPLSRGGAHVSPKPTGLLLRHLPGADVNLVEGKPKAVDRITIDAEVDAVICSYFAEGGEDVQKTISYALPGHGVAIASGDLNEDGTEDLVALAKDATGQSTATVFLANSPDDPDIKTRPFYYALASGSVPPTVPALLDIGFGRNASGTPFLAAVDRNNHELKVFFLNNILNEESRVTGTQTIGSLPTRPAGVRVRDFDQVRGDDIVVIADDGVYLFLASGNEFPPVPTLHIPMSLNPLIPLDLKFPHAAPILCAASDNPDCWREEFKALRLSEHVAAVSIDGVPQPDLIIPLTTTTAKGRGGPDYSYVVVILNPALYPTADYSVRLYRCLYKPRQVTVARMNNDEAPDLLLAGTASEDAKIQILFGNPGAPGTFIDETSGDPLNPDGALKSLPSRPLQLADLADPPSLPLNLNPLRPMNLSGPELADDARFKEVHTSNSSLEQGELPFSAWPLAEWIIASKHDRVFYFCIDGIAPDDRPILDTVPANEGRTTLYRGSAPEAIHVRDLFGSGQGGSDLALTDENYGRIVFLQFNGSPSGCPTWIDRGIDLDVAAPQHFASFSLDDGFFLAVASRNGTIDLFRRDCPEDCFFSLVTRIPMALQRQPHRRTHLSLYHRPKGAAPVAAARLIDFRPESGIPPRVELVSLDPTKFHRESFVNLGRQGADPLPRETMLPIGPEITGILLTEVNGDGTPDLLVARKGETWVTCHLGSTDGEGPFFEEWQRIDALDEAVQDWQITGEGDNSLDILVASPKKVLGHSLIRDPMHIVKNPALGFEERHAEQIAASRT